MRIVTLASSLAMAAACFTPAVSCDEVGAQRHAFDHYTFVTSSQKHAKKDFYVFETCVQNLTHKFMEFRWFTPGPHTWIPPQGHTNNVWRHHRLRDAGDSVIGSGCLLYGSLWEAASAEYIAPIDDVPSLQRERSIGCAKLLQMGGYGTQDPRGDDSRRWGENRRLDHDVTVFAPTDAANPQTTMTRLSGFISIFYESEGRFRHAASFSTHAAVPSDEYKGKLDGLSLLPADERVQAMYRGIEKFPFRIRGEGKLTVRLPRLDFPVLGEAEFRVLDDRGKPVATLFMPFLVSQKR